LGGVGLIQRKSLQGGCDDEEGEKRGERRGGTLDIEINKSFKCPVLKDEN